MSESKATVINDMTNQQFLETYAAAGRVGLVGAAHFIDYGIKRAQRIIRGDKQNSPWSHAILFEGRRIDQHHWLLESDLDIAGRNVRFGVQENRINKYFEAESYPTITILDFYLTPVQIDKILTLGLTLVAEQWKYSIRELIGTLVALPSRRLRSRPNLLYKERSLYCSAFVQHLFLALDYDFAPDADEKHTTPEHIFQTALPHTTYLLKR